jgi:hypothetical protein
MTDFIDAARSYLAFLEAPPASATERLRLLAELLDALVHAYHCAPESFVDDDREPSELVTSYERFRDLASRAFPDFGYYAVVVPKPEVDLPQMMGDAIDDLADIARDMAEVVWRWDNVDPKDAAWYYRLNYLHWGGHLLELRRYIHHLQFHA